jgi:RecQ family ATP-dependent DNA helicase
VTPELCETDNFRRHLLTIHAQGELNRVAIDEAHCISEWGHDFRPAYKELSWFKQTLKNPSISITALTATATPRVRLDIINLLGLDPKTLKTFNTPSARPNIHYEVKYLTDFACDPTEAADFQIQDVLSWLKSIHSRREARLNADSSGNSDNTASSGVKLPPISGIIYVPLRSVADSVARALSSSGHNIYAVAYHAGLANAERTRIQNMWTSNAPFPGGENMPSPSFSIIVATNAFGMGIDNPHVRFVIHWTPPRSFEGFVQESGRAGRDGRAAVSIVYYNPEERDRVLDRVQRDDNAPDRQLGGRRRAPRSKAAKERSKQARLESFKKVVQYCETTTRCRHEIIKEFSGDLELEMMGSTQESLGESTSAIDGHSSSPCDFACDFCKDGADILTKRKEEMIRADEETEKYVVNSRDPTFAIIQMMFPHGPYSRSGMRSAGPYPFSCGQCL